MSSRPEGAGRWPEQPPVGALRATRSSAYYDQTVRFYRGPGRAAGVEPASQHPCRPANGEESRTVRLLAAAGGLLVGLTAVPASAQEVVVARIHDLQGAAHLSPLSGQDVSGVEGIVTVERSSSFPLDL
jgi:hypothetical protein